MFWDCIKTLARGYEYMIGLLNFTPIAVLAWFHLSVNFSLDSCLAKHSVQGFRFLVSWLVKGAVQMTNHLANLIPT